MPARRAELRQRVVLSHASAFRQAAPTSSAAPPTASGKKTPLRRVPEARKGGEYKSPQPNVNDTDAVKIGKSTPFDGAGASRPVPLMILSKRPFPTHFRHGARNLERRHHSHHPAPTMVYVHTSIATINPALIAAELRIA